MHFRVSLEMRLHYLQQNDIRYFTLTPLIRHTSHVCVLGDMDGPSINVHDTTGAAAW